MFIHDKTSPKNGYNVYFESSIPAGNEAVKFNEFLRSLVEAGASKNIVGYYGQHHYSNGEEKYLAEYIKANTPIHAYFLVPGFAMGTTVFDIVNSAATASKVYAILLKEHLCKELKDGNSWSVYDINELAELKTRLQGYNNGKIVVITDPTQIIPSIEYSINSIGASTYRSNTERVIQETAEAQTLSWFNRNPNVPIID